MPRERFQFPMPASTEVVFDAFHYHHWRHKWDTLVSATHVLGDHPCPFVGALSQNTGAGWLSGLTMQTQFISYDRPKVAAAKMLGQSFPFAKWSASMRHQPIGPNESLMIYTYSFDGGDTCVSRLLQPIVRIVFNWQTKKRFECLQKFLANHAHEIEAWQQMTHPSYDTSAL